MPLGGRRNGRSGPESRLAEMRKFPRKLFRQLGELRDTQVLEDWVKRLSEEGDAFRETLLGKFSETEIELREGALRAAAKFDMKCWKKLGQALEIRARLVPADGPAAECLALERLEAAKQLHARTFRSTKPEAWHALRIGVKKFRYTVENLLPAKYESWGGDLKRVQDLLGEVHDLDVLEETIRNVATPETEELRDAWMEKLALERNHRLENYRQLTLGKTNLWNDWRQGLPEDTKLEAAGLAKLRVTVRSLDKNTRRSGQVSALAMKLYDGLKRVHAAPVFADKSLRKIMKAAARVHGIGSGLASKLPQKAARNFIVHMERPAGWSPEEWQLMSVVVRYHRGKQPGTKHKKFAKLGEVERGKVCACTGVLRLARILRKCGVERATGMRLEKSVDALIVLVPGLINTEETAAGIAAGKHLLETCIGCPILLKAVPGTNNVVELRKKMETASVLA